VTSVVLARDFAVVALRQDSAWIRGSNSRAGETTVSRNSELANLISALGLGEGERSSFASILRPINNSRGLACGESLDNCADVK
jgi:hypothetical protein